MRFGNCVTKLEICQGITYRGIIEMINHNKPPCPECGTYDASHHIPTCSLQTVEQKAALMMLYYQEWILTHERWMKNSRRLREMLTFWQGKHAILKQENNALRKKIKSLIARVSQ
jgi:hypothetical protein